MIKHGIILLILMFSGCALNAPKQPIAIDKLERTTQKPATPPLLSEHQQIITKKTNMVEIRLGVEKEEIQLSGDVIIQPMSFDGSTSVPVIVVHQGDYVELTLVNPKTSLCPQNIDFHPATGELNGGSISKVKPGEQATFSFTATRTGLFIYHCVPMEKKPTNHLFTSINGAIMVLPKDEYEASGDIAQEQT